MVDIAYATTGVDEVLRMLQEIRMDRVRQDVEDVIDEMASDAATYPPPPADSAYRRTNKLHDGWLDGQTLFPTATATELEAVRANSVEYGHWVMGAEDQATVHQGRWRTVDQLMDAWEARIAAAIEAGIEQRVGV